jgi:peptidoglycan/LPS O-acetylase OafA/YrhL
MTNSIGARIEGALGRPSGFDYLRIGLALAIFVQHFIPINYGLNVTNYVFSGWGRPPVAILLPMFFSLSGFLVAGSLQRCRTLVSFLGLRVLRIWPSLIFEVLLSALVLGPIFTKLTISEYFSHPLFRSYFLNLLGEPQLYLPEVFTDIGGGSVNAQLWTLPFELQCYLVLSAMAIVALSRDAFRVVSFVALFHVVVLAINIRVSRDGWISVHGIILLESFLAGVAAYFVRFRIPAHMGLFLASFALAYVLLLLPRGDYLVSIPVAYLVAYIGSSNPQRSTFINSGDYSYGIYLYGVPIQEAVVASFKAGHSWWAAAFISTPATLLVAWISWHVVEKRALHLRGRLIALETELKARRLSREAGRRPPLVPGKSSTAGIAKSSSEPAMFG